MFLQQSTLPTVQVGDGVVLLSMIVIAELVLPPVVLREGGARSHC